MSISIRLDVQQRNIFFLDVCLGWPRDTSNFLLLASKLCLAKIHHSILQSWPVTTASIAMPKLEEGAGQAKLSQARGVERILHSTHPFCQVEDRFFCVCPTRDIH